MAAHALIVGKVYREAETRNGKNGPYSLATVYVDDAGDLKFWSILAFDATARAELGRLVNGEALAIQGAMSAKRYEKNGAPKIGLSIIADHVLALRQPPRERKSAPRKPPPGDVGSGDAAPSFDDGIPF